VFQAYLTTFLVDPGFEKSISSTEEIFNSGIKYGFTSLLFDRNFNDMAEASSMRILQYRINCVDMVTCLLWTLKYRNISTISTLAYLEYLYSSSKYSDELKGLEYCALRRTPVLVTDLLLALQKGSPFLDCMNEIIGRLTESGIIDHLEKFNPEKKTYRRTKPITPKSLLDEYCALDMKNMQPAFFLLVIGYSFGLVTFLLEILYCKIHLQQH
jgi:hypothetical protein